MEKKSKKNVKNLFFEEVVNSITKDINERAIIMIADRFGFGNKDPKTLGEIGDNYGITRERVRQIIKEAINKAKLRAYNDELFKKAEEKIKFTINEKHGIISKEELIKSLANHDDEENFIGFVLHCSDNFSLIEDEEEMEESVIHDQFDFKIWKNIKEKAKEILHFHEKTLDSESFYKEFVKQHPELKKEAFFSFISVSKEIKKGVFDKWGIVHWKEIAPKGVKEKAHLIIKEHNKPLHFREVAKLIDKYKLNKRKTHPQTVHNELIKDDKFVLVGRGTYALREWGYQRGTVKDVITEILSSSSEPLHQDEIIKKVLSVRDVKKTTIIINLNNFFKKIDKQKYALKSKLKERA
jgi:DNA-directed RNA polymerase delta subunit